MDNILDVSFAYSMTFISSIRKPSSTVELPVTVSKYSEISYGWNFKIIICAWTTQDVYYMVLGTRMPAMVKYQTWLRILSFYWMEYIHWDTFTIHSCCHITLGAEWKLHQYGDPVVWCYMSNMDAVFIDCLGAVSALLETCQWKSPSVTDVFRTLDVTETCIFNTISYCSDNPVF